MFRQIKSLQNWLFLEFLSGFLQVTRDIHKASF